jgi:hypothetical protein
VQAYALEVVNIRHADLKALTGQIVAANIPNFASGSGFLWHKGHLLQAEDFEKLLQLAATAPPAYNLHLIKLEKHDVTEDEAGTRLAYMVAGKGIVLRGPSESRMSLLAEWRGLLKVDVPRLDSLNEVPGVSVFSLFNDQTIEAGTEVAGTKVMPLAYPESYLREAAALCADQSIISVLPFQKRKVGVVVRESLSTKARFRFETAVVNKINWFGGQLVGIETSLGDVQDLVQKMDYLHEQGAELILHVGGHSSDPLDPMHKALSKLDIRLEKQGAPAHPGTLFWLGYFQQKPNDTMLFGLASCGMFSKTTLGDLFMAKFFAGERPTYKDVAKMGHGGLLGREMAFRFPPYNFVTATDD